ncbi:3'-5' exoribonuclease [Arcicella aquatica]|uniref:3'-5' exoribonuclease n=1 Tax=Arcicella aquatica TaxID=217141 RepID=A0ABU5QT85_9BACT|nr:3'-5' exoribonuclease [Arcicella aquatica]MEA5260325.1 3'-5' exoribonuclease [Arcicella aquatica]
MQKAIPLFLDTEFTGLHQQSSLISIALVLDNQTYFYAELTDYDTGQISDWIQKNVIDNLLFAEKEEFISISGGKVRIKGTRQQLQRGLEEWFSQLPNVEIWADVLAYDWVLFCSIFGDAFQIPKNIFYIPFDMATALKIKGINPDTSRQKIAFKDQHSQNECLSNYDVKNLSQHNALFDAIVLKEVYLKLKII